MPAEHFEFAVVGGGNAGKTLAAKMATAGDRVVMIEKGMIGGSCINVAYIPTKTMVKSAKVAELARRAGGFGIRVAFDRADLVGVRNHKETVVTEMVGRNQSNFDRSGMTLIIGTARFTGPRALEVRSQDGGRLDLTADKVLVNTGTRLSLPPVPGLIDARPLNSETVQQLDRRPERLIVLGGGYIGSEFAQMFRRFGSQVTVIDRSETFLPREDTDVAEQVLSIFRKDGIDVWLGALVHSIEGTSGQSVRIRLHTRQAGKSWRVRISLWP